MENRLVFRNNVDGMGGDPDETAWQKKDRFGEPVNLVRGSFGGGLGRDLGKLPKKEKSEPPKPKKRTGVDRTVAGVRHNVVRSATFRAVDKMDDPNLLPDAGIDL